MKNVSLLDLVTIRMHIVVVLAKVFNYLDIYQSSLFPSLHVLLLQRDFHCP